ncbi:MAG: translocation/assembly module TamB domain-containing protein, partial [Desulforhabdus sp.]|nr:translocation/assembly module TamB domain-containing protein [Desulforhabdus sp.]
RLDPERVELEADFRDIPLTLASLFGGPMINGSAAGRIRLSGAPSDPQARVDIELKDVQSADPSLKDLPPVGLNASGRLQQSILRVDADLRGLTEKPARANLEAPVEFSLQPFAVSVPEAGQLAGQVEAEADLAKITQLVPLDAQAFSGRASVNFDVRGQIDAPQLDGFVTLENGSYENFETGTVLKNLNIRIASSGRSLSVEKLEATDGENGTVVGKGNLELDFDKKLPIDLDLTMSNATLVRRQEVTGAVDGTLKIEGSTKNIRVHGNLQASPAEINLPERLPPEMTQLNVIEIHSGKERRPVEEQDVKIDVPMQVALDIRVDLPRRIFVRGWGLDSEWRGNLKITGTAEKPSITGSLSTVRGRVDFLNRRFDIVNGDMTFYGGSPPLPNLDITAESKVKDVTARVNFRGSASNPTITLSSDPPLPQDEVLAKVLFGRSTTDISPTQALQLASVARSLSGRGSGRQFDFMSRTRDFLGLDDLAFDSSEEGFAKGTVGIGKYLTEGVYLNVQRGVGQDRNRATVEVQVTPEITVESQIGSDSASGIGINWKYDY